MMKSDYSRAVWSPRGFCATLGPFASRLKSGARMAHDDIVRAALRPITALPSGYGISRGEEGWNIISGPSR